MSTFDRSTRMTGFLLLLLLVIAPGPAAAAQKKLKLATQPSAEEFAKRRQLLATGVGNGVLVVLGKGDGEGEEVDADFYYLTGASAGGSRLVMKVVHGKGHSVLFLPPHNPGWERWNGPRLSPGEAATKRTGVTDTRPLSEFRDYLAEVVADTQRVLLPAARRGAADADPELLKQVRRHASKIAVGTVETPIHELRLVKSSAEVKLLREAIAITHRGLESAMGRARAGAWEFQVEGALEGTFMEWGSPRVGFPSIIGSGPNSCVLHYQSNRRQMKKGELLVMDVGATAQRYTADITRTIPISGKYSARQREVYNVVLAAQKAGIAAVAPGASFDDVNRAARAVVDKAGYGKYWFHGTSHWVGLDVHDVGSTKTVFEPGMVLTVEPGIYIAEEQLGIRIEDMVLVTSNGVDVLSKDIPKSPEALEKLVKSARRRLR